jgi:hypothetical protein
MGNAQGVCSNGDAVPDGEDISDTKRRFSMPDMTAADEMLAQGKDGMASVASRLSVPSMSSTPVTSSRKRKEPVIVERPFTPRETLWPLNETVKTKKAFAKTAPAINPVLVTLITDWRDVDDSVDVVHRPPSLGSNLDPPRAADHAPETLAEAVEGHVEDILDAAEDILTGGASAAA